MNFNVICYNINQCKFEEYDVMDYFIEKYNTARKKPVTFEEFKKFVESESAYMFWSRCEYEIILADWPNQKHAEKWDIHRQVMMNIDVITKILMENVL